MKHRFVLCVALAAAVLGSCNGGGNSACGDAEAQQIDPKSSQHLLPGAPEPEYNTDPPTSGAHAPGLRPTGILVLPLTKPEQVGMLESGQVLIQYGDIDAAQRRQLDAIAASKKGKVTIAPNESLPSPVVATAWLYMLKCDAVDKTAIEKFVDAHAERHAGH